MIGEFFRAFDGAGRLFGTRDERALREPSPSQPLWMDVPSAEALAFGGMTEVLQWPRAAGEGVICPDTARRSCCRMFPVSRHPRFSLPPDAPHH